MYPHPMQVTHHAHPDTRRDTNCSTEKNHWWRYIDKNWNNTGILVINVPIHILAKTIKQLPDQTEERDNIHRILWSAIGWVINKDVHKINKSLKYTSGISFIRLDKAKTTPSRTTYTSYARSKQLRNKQKHNRKVHYRGKEKKRWFIQEMLVPRIPARLQNRHNAEKNTDDYELQHPRKSLQK